VINEIRGNTYYANLHLSVEGKEMVVDSRPSDAIALAVRFKAPIFVAEAVVQSTKKLGGLTSSLLEDEDDLKSIITGMKPEDFGKYKM
jgi:bifunctional DNase/RNase